MSTFYEEGYYQGVITQQAMTKASTGNVQLVLKFKVLEFSDGSAVNRQYERTSYRTITDKTMPYLEKDLEVLGFTGTSLRQLDPSQPGFQSLEGTQVEFQCKHEASQSGDIRERWSVAWPVGGTGSAIEGAQVEPSAYRQLDALFSKGKHSATPAQTPPRTAPTTASSVITDDDIPF